MKHSVCAVICAAGKGLRAGFDKNKLFVPYDGVPVLARTVQAFCFDGINEIVVTYSPDDLEEMRSILSGFENIRFVQGGNTRTASVFNALQTVKSDIVLIHDGARPFVSRAMIEECIHSVLDYDSGICAVGCVDTIGVKDGNNELIRIPDRNRLVRIQTPQGFYTQEILRAYKMASMEKAMVYTDDSSVYAKFCAVPHLCDGSEENRKLTYASDFHVNASGTRVGFGIDTHAFGKAQEYITLAGVNIPSESGLVAHSDGDVLVHAVMDALLSAAGLKDIGHYFPDTDEKWKGASSMAMLGQVMEMLKAQGLAVGNISVSIQAEKPRLAKYIDEMKNALATALGIGIDRVAIAAGTNEGLGYVGEGKGITVHAYCLLTYGQ